MSHLLDVNLLLACGWNVHPVHAKANRWLNSIPAFALSDDSDGIHPSEYESGLRSVFQ